MRILDGAVTVFDGVAGVEPQSETVWRQANKYNVPRMCFVNKLDRGGANYFRCVSMIKSRLNANPVILTLPIGLEHNFKGIVDLISMKAIFNKNEYFGIDYDILEIPKELKEKAEEYREYLMETCSDIDDAFAEKYLEGKDIFEYDIINVLRRGTLQGKIVPTFCGSAFKNKGIQFFLDSIVNFLPSPVDILPVKGVGIDGNDLVRTTSDQEFFSALAFKIINDKYGQLTFIRVYSGIIKKGDLVLNMRTKKRMRIGRLIRMFADKRQDIDSVSTGDIAAVIGIDARTGDSLCVPENPIILESMYIPPSVVKLAIEPKTKMDQEKIGVGLNRLCAEDPSLRVNFDTETARKRHYNRREN